MNKITVKKISNTKLHKLLPELGMNKTILNNDVSFLCYEWQKENLIIFTNGNIRLINKWLKLLLDLTKDRLPVLGGTPSNVELLDVFPEDIGVNILTFYQYGNTVKKIDRLEILPNISEIFILGVANKNRTLGDINTITHQLLEPLPGDTETTLIVRVDERTRNDGVYFCTILKT